MRYSSFIRTGRRAARLGPVVTVIALLISGMSRPADAQRRRFDSDYRSRIDTTFAFDKSGTVTVRATDGDVMISGASGNQVHVHASAEDDNLRLDASGSRMTLEVTGGHRDGDTRIEVSVPYGVHVIVHTQSGDVSVRGTHGEVEADAQSGDVQVDDVVARLDVTSISGGVTATNITGDVQVVSTSGDVKLTDVRGSVDAQTVSGDVDLRGVTAKMVRAKTTSGDVTFDGLIDPTGRYELGAHSGDIRLHIQPGASAQITVATWSGSINPDFPITLKPGEHGIGSLNTKRFTFQIGGGAARITAETFSGDITIASNGRGAR